jgi:3-oxoacyl-[acyl-carrier protein] reductase
MIDLDGKSAFVTGAGRGIGRSIALELASLGARVALVARSGKELDLVAAEISRRGGNAAVIPGDLSKLSEIGDVVELVRARIGEPEILINNAATVAPLGATAALDIADVLRAITLNVVAPIALASRLIPAMIGKGRGAIINVSSGIAARPASMIGGNTYAVSKTALEAHTVNLAAELKGTGVTVNVFRPGTVDTQMQAWIRAQDPERIGQQLHERFARSYTEGTLITPDESARALVNRLDGDATGQIWDVADDR